MEILLLHIPFFPNIDFMSSFASSLYAKTMICNVGFALAALIVIFAMCSSAKEKPATMSNDELLSKALE